MERLLICPYESRHCGFFIPGWTADCLYVGPSYQPGFGEGLHVKDGEVAQGCVAGYGGLSKCNNCFLALYGKDEGKVKETCR